MAHKSSSVKARYLSWILYHPAGDRGVGLTLGNGFLNVGTHALDLVREFLLRKLIPKESDYAQGKP